MEQLGARSYRQVGDFAAKGAAIDYYDDDGDPQYQLDDVDYEDHSAYDGIGKEQRQAAPEAFILERDDSNDYLTGKIRNSVSSSLSLPRKTHRNQSDMRRRQQQIRSKEGQRGEGRRRRAQESPDNATPQPDDEPHLTYKWKSPSIVRQGPAPPEFVFGFEYWDKMW